jgi:hypothetical protein
MRKNSTSACWEPVRRLVPAGMGAEDLGIKWRLEPLIEEGIEGHALFRLTVCIDDGFLDQGGELGLRGRPPFSPSSHSSNYHRSFSK